MQAGLEEGERFTLANFSYSNSVILHRMFHHISSTNFISITVRVSLVHDISIPLLDLFHHRVEVSFSMVNREEH